MSASPDTGPEEDGTRTGDQWMNAMGEDVGIIRMQLAETLDADIADEIDKARNIAIALKEARRLESDIYRFAKEVHGIDKATLDKIGPL